MAVKNEMSKFPKNQIAGNPNVNRETSGGYKQIAKRYQQLVFKKRYKNIYDQRRQAGHVVKTGDSNRWTH